VSGSRVTFIGDALAAVVQGVIEVERITGRLPVVVGGLAVLARLSTPYRATVDLDVVDRMRSGAPHLEILRAADQAESVDPAAVVLPTPFGPVKIDVLEVRQAELDQPSDDPGDRLFASAHAWAHDSASDVTLEVETGNGARVQVATPVAEPGPLIAMKLQAIMNRSVAKQGTDLLDIVSLALDPATRPVAVAQIGAAPASMAADIAQHVDLWLKRSQPQSLRWIRASGGTDVIADDLELVAEILGAACTRA
jgi:hypothetical protein